MKTKIVPVRIFIFVCLLATGLKAHAQDSTISITFDPTLFTYTSKGFFMPPFNYIYHSPDNKDRKRYQKYRYLIDQKPTARNHELYYSLACSLWDLEKIAEAEKMFLAIIRSKEKYYTGTYYNSSDIPGDKTKNRYGYGSFTSNYKNYAAIYLAKIYIEQKKYDKALQFVEAAVKKYPVSYSCGTGYFMQKDKYDFLYASCYEGLNKHEKVIDLLLPGCLERSDTLLIAAIKNRYSAKEIEDALQNAEAFMQCTLDSIPSYAYQTRDYGTKKEKTDTIKYFSGSASIMLFGKQLSIPVPTLEAGEHMTRERFVELLKASDFYTRLKEDS